MNNSQISIEFLNLRRRLEFIKGILQQTSPMLDEGYQEIFADLKYAIEHDQEQIDSIREALKEEQ